AAAFHPDGQLLGCGLASGTVALWDVRAGTFAVDLADGHASPVTALHFSENGYHLATGARDGTAIEIWDLRKQAIFKTIALDHGGARAGSIAKLGGVRALQFDHAGHYLAAAVGSSVHVYVRKQWDALATLSDIHKPSVTGVQWGPDAQTLYTSGSDRTVIRFAVSSA
ncbi:WD40 repeat-like protein, partial [Caulochytrium protostelioides]